MKKILKKTIVVILIILANLGILLNTVQAVDNGQEVTIYSKGYFNRIIKKDGIIIKTAHAVYQENGKEYPVYCLNREVSGVGSVPSYNVKSEGKLQDLGLWRVIINGYPYKTLEQLGVASEEEAYIATKQSVYCYIYNTNIASYSAINEAGSRTIEAMKRILDAAKNSNETFDNPNIEIKASDKWEVDKTMSQYVSKQYEVICDKNISKLMINLESQPEGTKITNLNNQETSEFNSERQFKILIPIKSLKETGEFKIKVQMPIESKPILFGKAPSSDVQDYALTAFSIEDFDSELVQKYEKNNTKIIIEKKDKDTKKSLKNAKFEIFDKDKKLIKTAQTDDKGKITLEQLLPGTYYIKEVKAPEGYVLNSEMKKVELKMQEQALVKINNEKIIVTVKEEPKKPEVPVVEKPVVEIPKLPVTGM